MIRSKIKDFLLLTLGIGVFMSGYSVKAQAQVDIDESIRQIDEVVETIRRDILNEVALTSSTLPECDVEYADLREIYITSLNDAHAAISVIERTSAVERQAFEEINQGNFCDNRMIESQRAALDDLDALEMTESYENAVFLSTCAPELQETIALEMRGATNPARRAILDQQVRSLRTIRSESLNISQELRFRADQRNRIHKEMHTNISVCE